MFWISGGAGVVAGLAEITDWRALRWWTGQLEHVEWDGFHFWDLVFPLFLFISGVTLPMSIARRVERGDSRGRLYAGALRRGLLLVFLGVVYNGLFELDFANLRYASVLGRIGLAWMLAAFVVISCGWRGEIAWIAALLLGYWAALAWIPVPGGAAGDLTPGNTLADWLDRALLPGRLHRDVRDPEGLLSTLPAVATALAGALTGRYLLQPGRTAQRATGRKAAALALAGLACLALGHLWGLVFPINKNLWSSSFVVWTAGWSLLLLALFYLVIDVWERRRWAFFFVVIGVNPLTIYLLQAFVDFDGVAALVFANAADRVDLRLSPLGGLLLRWLLLYAMYRKGWFLRV